MPSIDCVPESIEELHAEFPLLGHSVDEVPKLDEVYPTVDDLPKQSPKKVKRQKREPFAGYSALPVLELSGRPVGTLTAEERAQKILKYLEKKKMRRWSKKVSYDCRKRVADNRLRIKGRFVTKEQAIAILGIEHSLVQKFIAKERDEGDF